MSPRLIFHLFQAQMYDVDYFKLSHLFKGVKKGVKSKSSHLHMCTTFVFSKQSMTMPHKHLRCCAKRRVPQNGPSQIVYVHSRTGRKCFCTTILGPLLTSTQMIQKSKSFNRCFVLYFELKGFFEKNMGRWRLVTILAIKEMH